jgi:hypothetical protein
VDRATSRRASSRTLATVDAAALIAFVLVGAANHGEGFDLGALVRTGLPVLAAWFLVGLAVGIYRRRGWVRFLVTWALAIPLGVVARSVIRGGPWGRELLIFGGVAMAFTLLFLLVGRISVWLVAGAGRGQGDP